MHVMPWFMASGSDLGWHWRMNRSSAEVLSSGRVASHFRPEIGPYDSSDPRVLDYQLSLMKIAGVDGVLADWYGIHDVYDYKMIHERTEKLFEKARKFGLSISVVYEDQSIGNPVKNKVFSEESVEKRISETGSFLAKHWLNDPAWLKLRSKPVMMVFGPQYFDSKQWQTFSASAGDLHLLTLHKRGDYAVGAYDWPIPSLGLKFTQEFAQRSAEWPIKVACAFPRFRDFYVQGGQEKGYPELPDDEGATFRMTLRQAIQMKPDAIQIATWNDWQEGTQVEPSLEFGNRDLVVLQKARIELDPKFLFKKDDLNLPIKLFRKRDSKSYSAAVQALMEDRIPDYRRIVTSEL
jgi:hypothetical protein